MTDSNTTAPVLLGTGVVLVNPQGHVLMARRLGQHGNGQYSIPGGAVDAGEDIQQAALRELAEETDIRLQNLTFIGLANNLGTYAAEGKHYASATFVATEVIQTPRQMEPTKLSHWQWYPMDAIPQPQFEASALALSLYRRFLATAAPSLISGP